MQKTKGFYAAIIVGVMLALAIGSLVMERRVEQKEIDKMMRNVDTDKSKDQVVVAQPQNHVEEGVLENGTYTNKKYSFKLNLPSNWTYIEQGGDDSDPVITFHKIGDDNFADGTSVRVAPRGIGTEGEASQKVLSNLKIKEAIKKAFDYTLDDGSKWATFVSFKTYPDTWSDSGFIFGKTKISEKMVICIRNGTQIKSDNCDYYQDVVKYSGKVNSQDWSDVSEIVSSFEFLKK